MKNGIKVKALTTKEEFFDILSKMFSKIINEDKKDKKNITYITDDGFILFNGKLNMSPFVKDEQKVLAQMKTYMFSTEGYKRLKEIAVREPKNFELFDISAIHLSYIFAVINKTKTIEQKEKRANEVNLGNFYDFKIKADFILGHRLSYKFDLKKNLEQNIEITNALNKGGFDKIVKKESGVSLKEKVFGIDKKIT